MTRRQMRESCFILLFEHCFTQYTPDELIELAEETPEVSIDKTVIAYFQGILERQDSIDEMILRHLKNWSLSRLSKVSLCLLRLAVYELCAVSDLDPAIVINEAVEIAKTYSTQDDASYINGVLGAVVKELHPEMAES